MGGEAPERGHGRPPRLFVEQLPEAGEVIELPAEARKHLRVLRVDRGGEVALFDGVGGEGAAQYLGEGEARTLRRWRVERPARELTLLVGLPKGQKLDLAVRMLTELGVDRICPVHSDRSVPTPGRFDARLARLRRIAREACAQSGRAWAPDIEAPRPLLEGARRAPKDATRLLFWEHATSPLPEAGTLGSGSVWAVIGPEGGLPDTEARALHAEGYAPTGLGPGVLRAETAAVVIAGLLLERLGRLRHPPPG